MNKEYYIIYGREDVGNPFEEIGRSEEKPNLKNWIGTKIGKKSTVTEVKACFVKVTRFTYERTWLDLS